MVWLYRYFIIAQSIALLVIAWPVQHSVAAEETGKQSTALFKLSPAQLKNGSELLNGKRILMHVVFSHVATIQPEPKWKKCVVEGPFRLTGKPADEVVLYNVFILADEYLRYADHLQAGSKITIIGVVKRYNSIYSLLKITSVLPGWDKMPADEVLLDSQNASDSLSAP